MSSLPRARPGPGSAAQPLTVEEIYRLNARTVARWAEHLGGPRLDAEEVVQEVFLVVNRRLEEFRGEAKLTTWLFRITSRVVANHRRRLRRRCLWARLTRRVAETTPAPGPAPGDQLELAQAARRFQRVMDGLSDRYREVLVLFELDEMATEQSPGCSIGPPATIRVWLHRARAQFTDRWQAALLEEAKS